MSGHTTLPGEVVEWYWAERGGGADDRLRIAGPKGPEQSGRRDWEGFC